MSCAFLNCGEICGGPNAPATSPFACPYAGLTNGLHAMAQPLTVLRGVLGAWKLRGAAGAESERYLDMSTMQVERMVDLLSCLRDVLDSADGVPRRAKFDIAELAGHVVEDMTSDLQGRGIGIEAMNLDAPVQVLGDTDRTECALRAALRAASSVSSAGGSIRLSIRPVDERVEVILEHTAEHGKVLNFADRLNLSLVETNIHSQGGDYRFVEDPLRILFALPADRPEVKDLVPTLHSDLAPLSP